MASVASQLIEEVTAYAQRDSLEDAQEICADGTYFPNNLRIKTCTNRTKYGQVLNFRYLQENPWSNMHSTWMCINQCHEMQRNYCTCIHDGQLRVTNSMAHIKKQNWILQTGTFRKCMMGKLTIQSFLLIMKPGFTSLEIWHLRITGTCL